MKPVLQALVLADKVYTDVTGKKIIAGTFHQILFNVPSEIERQVGDGTKQRLLAGGVHAGSPYAYISLTDVWDNTELTLQFVNLTQNKTLFGTKITISCDDRLKTIEIVAPLPPLPINSEGTYAIEVLCEGELIGSHRIVSRKAPPPPTTPGG